MQLVVQPLVRVSTSQTSPDAVIAPNGLACLCYIDNGSAYFQISDSSTGQQIRKRTLLSTTGSSPRAFLISNYFIITFIGDLPSAPTLQYAAIPLVNPTIATPLTGVISTDILSLVGGYDGQVINNQVVLAWAGTGSTLNTGRISQTLSIDINTPIVATSDITLISVSTDPNANIIWISYWDATTHNGTIVGLNTNLITIVAPTTIITGTVLATITSVTIISGTTSTASIFYQVVNNYSYNDSLSDTMRSDYIASVTVSAPLVGGTATVGTPTPIVRSVGLASKAFVGTTGTIYMLAVYGDTTQINPLDNSNQSTYFLIDSTGAIYMRLAYSNAGGYAKNQVLPTVSYINSQYMTPYLVTDFLATVNKATNATPNGLPSNAIYTQTGINLAKFSLNTIGQQSTEIAGALHLTGGMLWEYDGIKPVEHSFHVWPENVVATWSQTGGGIASRPSGYVATNPSYYYQFTYEWTDNAGNLQRSAPSIPIGVITTDSGSNITTGSVTINVPTLRLTYKQPFVSVPNAAITNPVRIVGYRWSVEQQVYYQFTSITAPNLNDTTIDSIAIVDTLADSKILGNTVLYTTGGVIEDIATPASVASTLFNNRLFLIDAEDPNLLWYSKQVIEAVPVEMSDLLTIYVAPTTGAQGSTGPMTALAPMDDKLIIFKKDAIYYINGTGPDNTGANSTFSDPVFVTGTVGCTNPQSIVLMPNGLMFQSDKGIWLLGRDLSTTYIGAPVESYNSQPVMSATAIPGTNQVRFILSDSTTLMYDYFFNQWGTHTNTFAISGTLYQGALTYLNKYGQIFQEVENTYIDGTRPVLMSITTSWLNVAGLQGYERFYFLYLLGTYQSPFKLNVQLAYDYNSSATQATLITPDNQSQPWGGEANWGSGQPWGGTTGNVFQARLFPQVQKCESFQVTINELYDPSFGQAAGQGLSLSGMNMVIGVKKGYRTQKASRSFG